MKNEDLTKFVRELLKKDILTIKKENSTFLLEQLRYSKITAIFIWTTLLKISFENANKLYEYYENYPIPFEFEFTWINYENLVIKELGVKL